MFPAWLQVLSPTNDEDDASDKQNIIKIKKIVECLEKKVENMEEIGKDTADTQRCMQDSLKKRDNNKEKVDKSNNQNLLEQIRKDLWNDPGLANVVASAKSAQEQKKKKLNDEAEAKKKQDEDARRGGVEELNKKVDGLEKSIGQLLGLVKNLQEKLDEKPAAQEVDAYQPKSVLPRRTLVEKYGGGKGGIEDGGGKSVGGKGFSLRHMGGAGGGGGAQAIEKVKPKDDVNFND